MGRRLYDIVLHILGEQDTLLDINPKKYTIKNLVDTIFNSSLMPQESKSNLMFSMQADCEDGGSVKLIRDDDVDLMFQRNLTYKEVHVWVSVKPAPQPLVVCRDVIELDDSDCSEEEEEGICVGGFDKDVDMNGGNVDVMDENVVENVTKADEKNEALNVENAEEDIEKKNNENNGDDGEPDDEGEEDDGEADDEEESDDGEADDEGEEDDMNASDNDEEQNSEAYKAHVEVPDIEADEVDDDHAHDENNGADDTHAEVPEMEEGSYSVLDAESVSEENLEAELGEQEPLPEYNSDDDLSDYSSDDYCPPYSLSDSEDDDLLDGWFDPMAPYLNLDDYATAERRPGVNQHHTLAVGDMFPNIHDFIMKLKNFSVQEGFDLKRTKNEPERVTVKCKDETCPWRLHASRMPDKITFCVKTMNPQHTCERVSRPKEANSTWMAHHLLDTLREHPEMKPKDIRVELQKIGVNDVPYMQIYRAKLKAMEVIEGHHGDSYSLLPRYAHMVLKHNPNSHVIIQSTMGPEQENGEDTPIDHVPVAPTFKRIFIGLDALRSGFLKGCSPFLGLDGCHLKGPHKGILLSAVSLDGDNGLYPVAWAVVESECKESWIFFFTRLEEFLGGFTPDKPWTLMSDRQKGLVECIDELVPHAVNRRCARHIFANMKNEFAVKILKKHYWMAVRAYNYFSFKAVMDRVKELNERAFNWLFAIDVNLWSRHAYPTELKNDHVTNNITESFNAWIGELRFKPVYTMLEGLRSKVMTRLSMRYSKAEAWTGTVMPNILKKANAQRDWSRYCNLMVSSKTQFEVKEKDTSYIVDLAAKTCDCGIWNLSGIPCRHASLAIGHNREKLEKYIDPSFHKSVYMEAYKKNINPVPDKKFWPELPEVEPSILLPPPLRRLPGRPRKHRTREQGEASQTWKRSSTLRCNLCKGFGHNKRTCDSGTSQRRKARRQRKQSNGTPSINEDIVTDTINGQINDNEVMGDMFERLRSRRRRVSQTESIDIGAGQSGDAYIPVPQSLPEESGYVADGYDIMGFDHNQDDIFF